MDHNNVPEEALNCECLVCRTLCIPVAEGEHPEGCDGVTVCVLCAQKKGDFAYHMAKAVLEARSRGFKEVHWDEVQRGTLVYHIGTDHVGPRIMGPAMVWNVEERICKIVDGSSGYFNLYREEVLYIAPDN